MISWIARKLGLVVSFTHEDPTRTEAMNTLLEAHKELRLSRDQRVAAAKVKYDDRLRPPPRPPVVQPR